MRYKPEHKEETHQKIVASASREFRSHGFEGVGIPKLMGALNLTHGGFYAHFADKEALVAEASALALQQSLDAMLAALIKGGVSAMLDFYLSEAHRDNPALGCLLPALTAEVARRPLSSRETFTGKLSEVFNAVAKHLPGQTVAQKQSNTYFLFAAMVGAVSLARAVSDPELSRGILRSTQEHLIDFINEAGG